MKRAAVIIGVDETGGLPKLQAAATAARDVAKWADNQQFARIELITDEKEKVEVAKIKKAIKDIVDAGTFEQLLIYFSGHGANVRQDEYWLLSEAPADPQEAVNVPGSVFLARLVGIPHIVFVSDACRTAAASLQAQLVTGSEIFPNPDVRASGKTRVDVFYATLVGKPALEIQDLKAADSYKSIYSTTLLDGLYGRAVDCIERVDEAGAPVGFVRPWPLEDYLEAEVPRRLQAAAVTISAFQVPDALINSREKDKPWLARFAPPPPSPAPTPSPRPAPSPTPAPPILPREPEVAFFGRRIASFSDRVSTEIARSAEVVVAKEAEQRATPFGPPHMETRCGFKVRGARFTEAYYPRSPFNDIAAGPLDSVAVHGKNQQVATEPTSVLLMFDNGKGTILPAIPEFITGLTFKEGELVDVVYEPADTSPRWQEYQSRADQLREVRGRIAAAAQFGVFRLEGEDVFHLARSLQMMKGLDPTMALYAAYAYDSLQETKRIIEMQGYLYDDLSLKLFDIALLAGALDDRDPVKEEDVFPTIPLLTQGWALLSAHRVEQPLLPDLRRFLESSLWTLFTPEGSNFVKQAWQSGGVH